MYFSFHDTSVSVLFIHNFLFVQVPTSLSTWRTSKGEEHTCVRVSVRTEEENVSHCRLLAFITRYGGPHTAVSTQVYGTHGTGSTAHTRDWHTHTHLCPHYGTLACDSPHWHRHILRAGFLFLIVFCFWLISLLKCYDVYISRILSATVLITVLMNLTWMSVVFF